MSGQRVLSARGRFANAAAECSLPQPRGAMMKGNATFTSPNLAKAISRAFGSEAKTFTVKMKHEKVVGDFIRKIDAAHKQAENSKLVFRA